MTAGSLSVAERRELGKRHRQTVHRVDQCAWKPAPDRASPVDLLVACCEGRVQELLPIRWARMALSPLGFFRGNVPVMAFDLAQLPRTGIEVQICGDAHVRNLGVFASPTGALVFDINDFDETIPGPWEWDLKRMATSLVLAGRDAGNSDGVCKEAVWSFVAEYRRSLIRCSELTVLELARYVVHRHMQSGPLLGVLQRAERATPQHTLEKLAMQSGDGARRIKEQKPLLTAVDEKTRHEVLAALERYQETLAAERRHFVQRYHPADVAFKVVGTGSVGTRDYVVLCFGNSTQDPLFLQIKEEPPSAYAKHLKNAVAPGNQGERVVQGQRLMQAQSDILLGWTTMEGRDYLVRQLADFKAAVNPADLKGHGLADYGKMCGEVLGKGHARSGDACVLAGYCGDGEKLDKAMAQFAFAYAAQVESDYKTFMDAVKKGRLKVMAGVT